MDSLVSPQGQTLRVVVEAQQPRACMQAWAFRAKCWRYCVNFFTCAHHNKQASLGRLVENQYKRCGTQRMGGPQYLEDAEVVAELADEGVALVGVVLRLHLDRPVKALQPLPCDACAYTATSHACSWRTNAFFYIPLRCLYSFRQSTVCCRHICMRSRPPSRPAAPALAAEELATCAS